MPLNYGTYNNDLSVPRKKDVDAKQDKITGAASTITDDNLTPGRMLISNTDGKVAALNIELDPYSFVEYNRFQQISVQSTLYNYQIIGRGFCFRNRYYIPVSGGVSSGIVFMETTDGLVYAPTTSFTFNYLIYNVAVSALNDTFVVIANNDSIIGTYNSMSNDNIVANTAPTSGKASHTDIYWNNVKSEFVLIGTASSITGITGMTSTGSFMYTSSDGLTWTLRVQGATGTFNQVRYVNNYYVITDKTLNSVYIVDGNNYSITTVTLPVSAPLYDIIQVGNKLTGLVAIEIDGGERYNIRILNSSDGLVWETTPEEYPGPIDPPTRFNNGLVYKDSIQNANAMGGYMFHGGSRWYYSFDGENWTHSTDMMGAFAFLTARGAVYFGMQGIIHPQAMNITYDLKTSTNIGVVLKDNSNGIINSTITGMANAVSADNVTQELGNSPNKVPSERAVRNAVPKITYGTDDLTAGTSELETGAIYLVYEV